MGRLGDILPVVLPSVVCGLVFPAVFILLLPKFYAVLFCFMLKLLIRFPFLIVLLYYTNDFNHKDPSKTTLWHSGVSLTT